jgi:alanyl-tRNA synthetase
MRVEFVCGGRATRRARADYDTLARLGGLLSTSLDGVLEVVDKRLAELTRDGKALRAARESLDGYRASELYAKTRAETGDGLAIVLTRQAQGSVQDLRGLAQAYVIHAQAVFIAVLEQPPSILLATSADTRLDAGALLGGALARAGGRGGGSARLAQGTVENAIALDAVLSDVRRGLGLREEQPDP